MKYMKFEVKSVRQESGTIASPSSHVLPYLQQVTDIPWIPLHVVVDLVGGNRCPLLVNQDLLNDKPHAREPSIVCGVPPHSVLINLVHTIYEADLQRVVKFYVGSCSEIDIVFS